MKFQELGLPEKLCHALAQAEITEPTAVQVGAIPAALAARDIISSARTGSGKTLAYSLPTITRLSQDKEATALVLVPTREIGNQVQNVLQPYLKAMHMAPPALIIGGVSFGPQIQSLRRQPAVIIATPGRLNDHLQNGKLRLDHVKVLILDEADRMLDMGFLPQVKQILRHLSSERQTLLFSATMPPDLKQACRAMMRDPEMIAVDAPNVANAAIEQRMHEVEQDGKQDALLEAIGSKTESVLVFARTKRRTDRVAIFLERYGVKVDRIHGDRSQAQRQKAIDNFRSGRVKVLVATDIAARGLDIPLVELVVNFDLPEAKEDYVHRIGRTGRAAAPGEAVSFVTPEERGHWASITGQKREHNSETRGGGRSRPPGKPRFERGPRKERPVDRGDDREAQDARAPRASGRFRAWGAKPAEARESGRPSGRERGNRFSQRREDSFRKEAPRGRRDWNEPQGQSGFREEREKRDFRSNPDFRDRENQRFGGFAGKPGSEKRSFQERESRPRPFGGHGRSAPPAEGAPRGRWKKRPNRPQPDRDSSWS